MKKFISIQQQDGTEQQFAESDLPIVIGSAEDRHIGLPGVEVPCAYIAQDKGHYYIQPAGGNQVPVFHNDHLLTASAWLKSRDKIRIGRSLVHYSLSGDRITIQVSEITRENSPQEIMQPPSPPPPPHQSGRQSDHHIPVAEPAKKLSEGKKKSLLALVGLAALVLGCGVLFVLSARPLMLDISPEPDHISLEGFPPPLMFASSLLALPGTYSLLIEKKGYVPVARTVLITREDENRFSAVLEKLPGILELMLNPPGEVAAYFDDRLLGVAPAGTIEVPAGHHRLRLERERYQPYETDIVIEGMGLRQVLEATLEPDWASVTITSEPTGAAVTVDDGPAGTTPLTLDLLSGSHTLLLSRELFLDYEQTISVTAGSPAEHHLSLKPLPGQLTLISKPDQAAVRVNKVFMGSTPVTVELSPDKAHEVVISLAGFLPSRTMISLLPGEKKRSELNLEPEKGIVYLLITPPDATVTLDGSPLQDIQGRLRLTVEPHTLEVQAAGYRSQRRTIMPKSGFSQQVSIDLVPLARKQDGSGQHGQAAPQTISSGQRLLFIQPSSFVMGAPRREPGRRANEHERNVTLKKPFYLSQKLVSNREFRLFNKEHVSGSFGGISLEGDDYPVVNIGWEDAVRYLNWLSARDGLEPFYREQGSGFDAVSPPTNGYRLPTEAEWAFSARLVGSPTPQRFPWSGGFPPRMKIGNFADESARNILPSVIDSYNDGFPATSPLGSFPANKGGFYDMGGNVAEWCHDFYSPYPPAASQAEEDDPLGPSSGAHHVVRGSSWRDSSITELRLSYRSYQRAPRNYVGFRIARYQ